MQYHHTIKDISKDTGLKTNFIRRILREAPEITEYYAIKTNNNAFAFNDNALIVFREAAKLKEQKATLSSIIEHIEKGLQNQAKKDTKDVTNPHEKPFSETLLKMLESSYTEVVKAKEALIEEQHERIKNLNQQILLLTDGRSPGEIKKEKEAQQKSIAESQNQIEQLNQKLQEKQREVADYVESESQKKSEIENLKTTLEEVEQAQKLKELKKEELVQQINSLSWYQTKRKKDLLKQLSEL